MSTAVTAALVTSALPCRSTTAPRGARTGISRVWFAFARAAYSEPARTCSVQSRIASAAKPTRRTALRIANRRASFGVTRYGSTAESRSASAALPLPLSRARPAIVLAKELYLRAQLGRRLRPQQPPHERIDRPGDDEVEEH